MTPDYSPAMLKAFLHARVVFAAGRDGVSQALAWRALRGDLRKASRLKAATLDDAYRGQLFRASHRAALWAAMGVHPADFAVLLDDAGKQEPEPHCPPADTDNGPQWSPAASAALNDGRGL